VYGAVAIVKVIVACVLWFWYFGNGKSTTHVLVDGYWRVWFSSFMAVMLSWGPVVLFYGLQFAGTDKLRKAYMWVCMISVDGPMLAYFVPLALLLLSYLGKSEDGLQVTSPVHFWMGWVLLILITVLSFTFQIVFLPSIRIWYAADGDYSFLDELDEDGNPIIDDEETVISGDLVEDEVITFNDSNFFDF
jgi:hypothetical protein